MNSKHFDKFYKDSAFYIQGNTPVRESVVKTILDKFAESIPEETSGCELSLALSFAIMIVLEAMGLKDSKQIDCYMELLKAEVNRTMCMVNDHEISIKPLNSVS